MSIRENLSKKFRNFLDSRKFISQFFIQLKYFGLEKKFPKIDFPGSATGGYFSGGYY